MKILAETERLLLREIHPTDVDGFFELDADPEVHRYLGNNPITDKDQCIETINFIRQQYMDHGIGRWAIIDRKTNAFMGWSGLKLETVTTNNHQNYYDLGYRLIKRYWGLGIATETSLLALDYGFKHLNIDTVYAAASCENIGSNKVLKKVGLHFVETFYYEDMLCNWYKIDKHEYENKKSNH